MDIIGHRPVIHTWFSLHSVRGYHWAPSSYTHLILIAQCSWISLGTVQLYTPDSHCTVFVDIIGHCPVIHTWFSLHSVRGYHWALSSYTHLILIAQCSWISLGTVQLYTPDSHSTVFVDIIGHRPVIHTWFSLHSVRGYHWAPSSYTHLILIAQCSWISLGTVQLYTPDSHSTVFMDIIRHCPVIHTWFSLHSVRGYHWALSCYTHLILIAQCSWISLGTVQLYTPDSHCTVFVDIIGHRPVIHTWFSLHSVRGYHWAPSSYTHLILIAQCSWISLGTVQLYSPDSHSTVFMDIIRHRPVIHTWFS